MKRMLLVPGALLLLGGGLRAQDDSLEKIQKDVNKVFQKAKSKADLDQKELEGAIDRAMNLAVDHKKDATGFQAYEMAMNLARNLSDGSEKITTVYTEAM